MKRILIIAVIQSILLLMALVLREEAYSVPLLTVWVFIKLGKGAVRISEEGKAL